MIPDEKAFGRWVRVRREFLGMTQEQLAAHMKKTKGYINKIENASPHTDTGKPPAPTLELLYTLSRSLGVSLATPLVELGYLKKSEAEMGTSTGAITAHPIKILHYYNQLSEADQETAIRMVKSLWESRQAAKEMEPKRKAQPSPEKKKRA